MEVEGSPSFLLQEMIDDLPVKLHVVLLEKTDRLTIGRGPEATIRIFSFSVSRRHAFVEWFDCLGWCITDDKSMNGVYIDDTKCAPGVRYQLKHGQKISLAPKSTINAYLKFYNLSKGAHINEETSCTFSGNNLSVPTLGAIAEGEAYSLSTNEKYVLETLATQQSSNDNEEIPVSDNSLQRNRWDQEVDDLTQDCPHQNRNSSGGPELENNNSESGRCLRSCPENSPQCPPKSDSKPEDLKDKTSLVTNLEKNVEAQKLKLEELENTLMSLSTRLPDFSFEFLKFVEGELTCAICTEIFIEPSTLACGHTFCSYCLVECRKVRDRCPICRKLILLTISRSLVLENLMEKIIVKFDENFQRRREGIITKRKAQQTVQDSTNSGAFSEASFISELSIANASDMDDDSEDEGIITDESDLESDY